MKYALNLEHDGRILSACVVLSAGHYDGMPMVDELPDGDIADYRYMDGQYAYDPLPQPEPEPEQQTTEELLLETAADHEYRICLMELGVSEDDL